MFSWFKGKFGTSGTIEDIVNARAQADSALQTVQTAKTPGEFISAADTYLALIAKELKDEPAYTAQAGVDALAERVVSALQIEHPHNFKITLYPETGRAIPPQTADLRSAIGRQVQVWRECDSQNIDFNSVHRKALQLVEEAKQRLSQEYAGLSAQIASEAFQNCNLLGSSENLKANLLLGNKNAGVAAITFNYAGAVRDVEGNLETSKKFFDGEDPVFVGSNYPAPLRGKSAAQIVNIAACSAAHTCLEAFNYMVEQGLYRSYPLCQNFVVYATSNDFEAHLRTVDAFFKRGDKGGDAEGKAKNTARFTEALARREPHFKTIVKLLEESHDHFYEDVKEGDLDHRITALRNLLSLSLSHSHALETNVYSMIQYGTAEMNRVGCDVRWIVNPETGVETLCATHGGGAL